MRVQLPKSQGDLQEMLRQKLLKKPDQYAIAGILAG
jgi:hypothetical protein